jgi:hypothetical protein
MKDAQAVLVLPPAAFGKLTSPDLRRWLARGQLSWRRPDREMLANVVELLGAPMPEEGAGALRFWGQSGQRSRSWMAAADPVHLETRMRDVRIRHIAPGDCEIRDLEELVETLQNVLGGDGRLDFIRIGPHAYVRSAEPFDSPRYSAAVADGEAPDMHTPFGPAAAAFHRLLGETEMIVHDHAVNSRRIANGKSIINSFWYWGGGIAPEIVHRELPPLFTGDALFRGYWASAGAAFHEWGGDLAECLEAPSGRFVAVLPDLPVAGSADVLEHALAGIREHMRRGELASASLFFRDGLRAIMRRSDRFKVWRKAHQLLESPDA